MVLIKSKGILNIIWQEKGLMYVQIYKKDSLGRTEGP